MYASDCQLLCLQFLYSAFKLATSSVHPLVNKRTSAVVVKLARATIKEIHYWQQHSKSGIYIFSLVVDIRTKTVHITAHSTAVFLKCILI